MEHQPSGSDESPSSRAHTVTILTYCTRVQRDRNRRLRRRCPFLDHHVLRALQSATRSEFTRRRGEGLRGWPLSKHYTGLQRGGSLGSPSRRRKVQLVRGIRTRDVARQISGHLRRRPTGEKLADSSACGDGWLEQLSAWSEQKVMRKQTAKKWEQEGGQPPIPRWRHLPLCFRFFNWHGALWFGEEVVVVGLVVDSGAPIFRPSVCIDALL